MVSKVSQGAPLVSFVIPCYNHEVFIYQTLDSIRDDLHTPKEILLLDDGSTDNSVIEVKKWIRDNPQVDIQLFEQKNTGIVPAINKLVGWSKGDYIRLFSSDDINIPDSTTKLLSAITQDGKYEAAFGDAVVVDEHGGIVCSSAIQFQKKNKEMYGKDLGHALIMEWGVSGPCILYSRKGYFDVLGGYNETLAIEDWFSYLKFHSMGKIRFIDENVVNYRIHSNNSSRTIDSAKRLRNQKSHLDTINLVLPLFQGREKELLHCKRHLTVAKIGYLKSEYGSAALNTLKYLFRYMLCIVKY